MKEKTELKTAETKRTKKKRSKSQTVLLILIILCLLGAVVSAVMIFGKYWIIRSDQDKAKDLYSTTVSDGDTAPESSDELDPNTGIISDFNALHSINPDVKGYLWVDDTKLSTVVVQGTDNDYYLRHNFYGKTILGIPFIDYRASLTAEKQSMNLTIYGHAAQDGSYFAPIKSYKSLDYYRAHPVVNFDTTYGRGKYKIIGAFMAEVREDLPGYFNYHDYVDMSEDEYNTFITEIDRRSYFNTSVDVRYGDEFITLSTCETLTDEKPTPYRMVVVARKVRPGESYAVDTASAKANTDMIMPEVWVQQNGKANPYA